MDGTAVTAIANLAETKIVDVAGKPYSTKPLAVPPGDAIPEPLPFNTLTGLLDHLRYEAFPDVFIHVASQESVGVVSKLSQDRYRQRLVYSEAHFADPFEQFWNSNGFRFGVYYDVEIMTIALQSLFVASPGREALLKLLASVRDENVRTADDDGVTQVVATKAGVVLNTSSKVPSPLHLAPFRTFSEVTQPDSPFVVRAKQGGAGSTPTFALFLADGGAWKLEAIQSIKLWIEKAVSGWPASAIAKGVPTVVA